MMAAHVFQFIFLRRNVCAGRISTRDERLSLNLAMAWPLTWKIPTPATP